MRRFTLELDCHANPIAGRLLEEGGEGRSFAGWLGLAAALEHFCDSEEGESNRHESAPAR